MKIYASVVDDNIMKYFPFQAGINLFNHATNSCTIEHAVSVASYFCPAVTEVDDFIFISYFYNGGLEDLKVQFGNDRKKIEMFVNSWSLSDFFREAWTELVNDDEVIINFGHTLQYFWQLRMKELFPERNIKVELGDNIMGEAGLTITVYQE
jgi:hypothetical protein